jgi:hypothetical protein
LFQLEAPVNKGVRLPIKDVAYMAKKLKDHVVEGNNIQIRKNVECI